MYRQGEIFDAWVFSEVHSSIVVMEHEEEGMRRRDDVTAGIFSLEKRRKLLCLMHAIECEGDWDQKSGIRVEKKEKEQEVRSKK